MSVEWIEYRGRRILFVDFRAMSEDAMIAQLDEEVAMLRAAPSKSRLLVEVTDAFTSSRFMAAAKAKAKEIESLIDRQAIVGVDGLKSILLRGFNAVSKGVILKPFDTEESAKEYLSEK